MLVDDYGRYTQLEAYLKRLFPEDLHLHGIANLISKKCCKKTFLAEDLPHWMSDKRQDRYGVHLTIAKRFLSLLQAG